MLLSGFWLMARCWRGYSICSQDFVTPNMKAPGLLLLLPVSFSPLISSGKLLLFYNSWTVVVDLGRQMALVTLHTWRSLHILLVLDRIDSSYTNLNK